MSRDTAFGLPLSDDEPRWTSIDNILTTLTRKDHEPTPGRDLNPDHYMTSPLLGALLNVAEGTALLVGADVAAGRLYGLEDGAPCAYVGTAGLDVAPHLRRALQTWPLADSAIFATLGRRGPCDQLVSMPDVLTEHRGPAERAVPPPLNTTCRLADAFFLTCEVEESCWLGLLMMRNRRRSPFVSAQRDLLHMRRQLIQQTLRRGLQAQQSPQPSPNDLLARLSRTETQVLSHLRHGLTERQVARRLGRSPHTIHVHVKNIYRKLAVRSREQLLALLPEQ